MNSRRRALSILLLLGTVLFADAALGQSLTIIRNGSSNFSIQTTAPADARYVLQESANLHLWVDINDQVSGQSSNRFASAGNTQRFFRLTPWTPPAPPIILVLLGDSTVWDGSGWGQGIYGYFKTNVRVVNLAAPGYSTKRFLSEAEKTTMLTIRPDFVLVQFGWFDACINCPGIGTTLPEYADNLKTIIQTIRGFNGTPILITTPALRIFDDKGKVVRFLQDRCAIVKDVAAETQTAFIDLNQLSMDLYNELGGSASAYISWTDNTHYTPVGAQVIAGLVVNALPDRFGPYLVGIFNPPTKL